MSTRKIAVVVGSIRKDLIIACAWVAKLG